MKKVRTIRIDKDISTALDSICVRHGDVSWHIEQALTNYFQSLETPKPKAKKTVAKFIKPELAELAAYFHEKGSNVCNDDAQSFMDHFTANGWKVGGKAQMKDWKAAVRNWMRGKGNENSKPGSAKGPTKREAASNRCSDDLETIRRLAESSHSQGSGVLEGDGQSLRLPLEHG